MGAPDLIACAHCMLDLEGQNDNRWFLYLPHWRVIRQDADGVSLQVSETTNVKRLPTHPSNLPAQQRVRVTAGNHLMVPELSPVTDPNHISRDAWAVHHRQVHLDPQQLQALAAREPAVRPALCSYFSRTAEALMAEVRDAYQHPMGAQGEMDEDLA